jgi:hypothetical protein
MEILLGPPFPLTGKGRDRGAREPIKPITSTFVLPRQRLSRDGKNPFCDPRFVISSAARNPCFDQREKSFLRSLTFVRDDNVTFEDTTQSLQGERVRTLPPVGFFNKSAINLAGVPKIIVFANRATTKARQEGDCYGSQSS